MSLALVELWKHWEGHQLGRAFVLDSFLGGSARGGVFLSEYGAAPKVAVKLIPLDPEEAGMELRRLDAAAKLSHPHLIGLLDWGVCRKRDQHLLYVVMEHAPEDLSQVLRERPLNPSETLEVLASALDALAYLHRKGFIHGHLKPANILAVDGLVKISSDRLDRAAAAARAVRAPGVYDPPEVARGKRLPAGDVWMLALTIVEMLTRQLPGTERKDWEAELLGQLPEPFLDIARHCLQEDPRHRWPVDRIKARLASDVPPREPQPVAPRERIPMGKPTLSWAALNVALGVVLIGSGLLLRYTASQPGVTAHGAPAPSSAGAGADRLSAVRPEGAPDAGAAGVIRQVLPVVPVRTRLAIQGTLVIGVIVQVDAAGAVVAARYESPGANEDFFDLALAAARNWKFVPASPKDARTGRTWLLRFEFRRTGTEVQLVRVS